MKYNKILFGLVILSTIFLSYSVIPLAGETSSNFGTIIVAHSSRNTEWNQQVKNLHTKVASRFDCPVEIAFLGFLDTLTLETAIERLMGKGVTQILLVHLSPSSFNYSERIKSFAEKAVANLKNPSASAKYSIEIMAMDDHPLAVEILKESARSTSGESGNIEKESLLLVGGGPIAELENTLTLIDLERIGDQLKIELGFREVVGINLRAHSPDVIFVKSINDLRRTAKRLNAQGRVIVVPYVLQNDFNRELESYLGGAVPPDDISKQEIISHPKMEQWAEEIISMGMNQSGVKKINRNWSAMKDREGLSQKVSNFGLRAQ